MKVIKKISCIALVLILFLHTNYLVVYYSLYSINARSLTESCCKKIVVNCNAHCYLDEKMNEESNNKSGAATDIKLKITEYVVEEYFPNLNTDKVISYNSNKNFMQVKDYYSEIEHPPQL